MIDYLQVADGSVSQAGSSLGPLVTPQEVLTRRAGSGVELYDAHALAALSVMARYVLEFLTSAHPELGRTGAVCPFAAAAAAQTRIRLAAFPGEIDEATITSAMLRLRGELTALGEDGREGREPEHRAIVTVFPGLSEPQGSAMIERIQKRLKLSFISQRLMIGQFYPSCPEPGLWNRDFRPLQTPVISLAIRDITISDAPFMLERPEYVDAFEQVFGARGRRRIAKALRDRNASSERPAWTEMEFRV